MTATIESTLYAPDESEVLDHDTADQQPGIIFDEEDLVRHKIAVHGGGANTEHFGEALDKLGREGHDVHIIEVREPARLFPLAQLHLVNTPEGRAEVKQLYDEGLWASYCSRTPDAHVGFITQELEHVGEGRLGFTVIAKPAVQNVKEMGIVDNAKKAAEAKLRERFGPEYDPEENPILYVHEHYKEKGPWHALREQLGEVTNRLGRLRSVVVDIEEARTVEQENRVAAFRGGALEDLGPHVISLGLDIQTSINNTPSRYTIPDRSETSVRRFRYKKSDLPEGVETGFIVNGSTTIIDHEDGDTAHDVRFVWRGGKGLVDKKEAVLEFKHPDTGEISIIRVDLQKNTLEVPESIREDLFPQTEFDENGYKHVVQLGFNGGDPRKSFQPWAEARVVTKWSSLLARQSKNSRLHVYKGNKNSTKGLSLQELEQASTMKSQGVVRAVLESPIAATRWLSKISRPNRRS